MHTGHDVLGDATLDGVVNDDDVTLIGALYAPNISLPDGFIADLNHDRFINDDDVTILGVSFNPEPETPPHSDDPVKRGEHEALLKLVPYRQATYIAIRSGAWSDPLTWSRGISGTPPHAVPVRRKGGNSRRR